MENIILKEEENSSILNRKQKNHQKPEIIFNKKENNINSSTKIIQSNPNFVNRKKIIDETTPLNCAKIDIIYTEEDNNIPYLAIPYQREALIVILALEKMENLKDINDEILIEGNGNIITFVKYFDDLINHKKYLFSGEREKDYKVNDVIRIYELKSINNIVDIHSIEINDFVTAELLINGKLFLSSFYRENYKKMKIELKCYSLPNFTEIKKIDMKNNSVNKIFPYKNIKGKQNIILFSDKAIIIYNLNKLDRASSKIITEEECMNGCVIENNNGNDYLCVAHKYKITLYDLNNNIIYNIENDFIYKNRYIGSIIAWDKNYIIFPDSTKNLLKVFNIATKRIVSFYQFYDDPYFMKYSKQNGEEGLLISETDINLYIWKNNPNLLILNQ